ncbi:retrovirus-related pol polyprotein from transposon TNT 1-94 [Tanacetum coccineum]
MAPMAENFIAAGSKTRPPMLEKGMYDSWKTRIIIYIQGKENGEMLRDSVKNGPYKFKSEITVKDTNDVTDIRRAQRLEDLVGNMGSRQRTYERHIDDQARTTPITQQLIQSPPLQSYAPTVVQQPPIFQPDTGLAIPTFLPTDDPIASLNKAMIFLSLVYRSKFPPTNNQPRTSSNPRTQATIQNGQVMVQNVQGRQSQGYAGNAGNNQASRAQVINTVGNTGANQPRVIRCYNCNGEGHMAKQCTARKRVKDSEWFKEKMLLAQAQEARVVLDEEQQADHVDAYDSDCDDEATANAIFMANLSQVGSLNDDTVAPRYDSDTLSEVPHYDTYHDSNVLNSNIQELGYIENIISNNDSYDELKGNRDVISYTGYMLTIENDEDNYVPPPVQKNDMMLSVTEQMKSQVEKCNKVNQDAKSVNESLTSELEQYKDKVRVLEYAVKDGHSEKEAYVIPKVVEKNDLSKSVTSHLTTNKKIEKCTKVLAPGRVSSTNASGSKPRSNTKNDRIPQPSSISMKNKVKAYHRKFKSSANKNNHVSNCNANVKNIVEIVLWYLDFGCSKHMTGHRDKLINFVSKFIGTVRFENDHFAAIIGYGDLQMRNILISRVYYVKGLGHNLFFVGLSCDSDLEVAFRKHTCFVRNLEGVDLLSGSRVSNLYIISMADIIKSSPICLLSKSTKIKSWLWHHRLSYLNFGTINKLAKQGLVKGLPKLKYTKDHLITHNTSTARTPQQNGVVERRNRMLVEAARTMLIFSKSLLFLWAEAVTTACYTQNRSLIHTRYDKTPYELLRDRKPELKYLYVFDALLLGT